MTPRPLTLRQIAERSDSLEEFGRHFQDWLHTVRSFTSRPQVEAAVHEAPPRLARRFAEGTVADAWLAAYGEHVVGKIARPVPAWTTGRVSPLPWFAVPGKDTRSRLAALRDAPTPFKSRNLYTPAVDLPLSLSAGRPAKTTEEKRRANADRQKRFRDRRHAELQQLRQLVRA
jgi:hypothetical protein